MERQLEIFFLILCIVYLPIIGMEEAVGAGKAGPADQQAAVGSSAHLAGTIRRTNSAPGHIMQLRREGETTKEMEGEAAIFHLLKISRARATQGLGLAATPQSPLARHPSMPRLLALHQELEAQRALREAHAGGRENPLAKELEKPDQV